MIGPTEIALPQNKPTTLRLSKQVADAFTHACRSKYGVRGTTRWVEEALSDLLAHPSFATKVGVGELNAVFDATKALRLTPAARTMLEDGIRRYRRINPLAEGLSSQILRAAIKLRLEKDAAAVEKPVEIKAGSLRRKAPRTAG